MLPRVTVGDSVPCGWPCDRAQAGNQPKPVILSGPPSGTNEGGNGAAPRQRTCSTPCARPAAPTREEMERPCVLHTLCREPPCGARGSVAPMREEMERPLGLAYSVRAPNLVPDPPAPRHQEMERPLGLAYSVRAPHLVPDPQHQRGRKWSGP